MDIEHPGDRPLRVALHDHADGPPPEFGKRFVGKTPRVPLDHLSEDHTGSHRILLVYLSLLNATVSNTWQRSATSRNRKVRALRPWSDPDLPLLRAINNGAFITNGFRNKDLLPILFPAVTDPVGRRRASAKITRLLRILRAHRIIERAEGTHRYVVTAFGRSLITAVLSTNDASICRLRKSA